VEHSNSSSSSDEDSMETEPLATRIARQSRTTKPVKYNVDLDDDGDNHDNQEVVSEEEWMVIDSEESEEEPPPKKAANDVITVVDKPKKTVKFEEFRKESKDTEVKSTITKVTKPKVVKTTKPKSTKSNKKEDKKETTQVTLGAKRKPDVEDVDTKKTKPKVRF